MNSKYQVDFLRNIYLNIYRKYIYIYIYIRGGSGWVMVFNATFNNISVISWWSALLVEETGVPGENVNFA